jgi:hypothetical protein
LKATAPDELIDGDRPLTVISTAVEGTERTPSINSSGTVAFATTGAVFIGSGGPLTTIANSSGAFSGFITSPSINDSGTVAFRAFLDAGGSGVFTGNGGPVTTVANTSGPFSFFDTAVSINASGTVAFRADLDGGGKGIFLGSGGAVTTIADDSGPFSDFTTPAINASGAIAFRGATDSGPIGIFTGDNPSTDKVIAVGDALFGSTVTTVNFANGLNDDGDIAFFYRLADGRFGIAVAVVPEPAAVALLMFGGLVMRRVGTL